MGHGVPRNPLGAGVPGGVGLGVSSLHPAAGVGAMAMGVGLGAPGVGPGAAGPGQGAAGVGGGMSSGAGLGANAANALASVEQMEHVRMIADREAELRTEKDKATAEITKMDARRQQLLSQCEKLEAKKVHCAVALLRVHVLVHNYLYTPTHKTPVTAPELSTQELVPLGCAK